MLGFFLLASAGWLTAAEPAASQDEQAILKIEKEACDAYLHGDADYLAGLLTDDFSFTNGRAEMNNKQEELAEVRAKKVHYTTFENQDMKVHLHGGTAVVIGKTIVKGTTEKNEPIDIAVEFTDVFTKIGENWKMLAGHVSRIPK